MAIARKAMAAGFNVSHWNRMALLKGAICILPFVVFYWLMPFYGTMTIGNDYPRFAITQQMELQYSLARGSFPLYAPGFAGGRSAAALTLGGIYHPLSHLAAHSPGYWNGGALEWNTLWRLLSLGLTQLVLFNLLRRLELSTDFAFIVSFVTVYNLRTLDMFRYGASLENYVGFLLLFAAMINLYLAPNSAIGLLSVIGATYLMICGGHPQIAYFGLLGAALLCLAIPEAVAAMRPDLATNRRRTLSYYAAAGGYVGLGLLLATAYTLPFYVEFLRDAPARTKQSYQWSVLLSDHWGGAANSFFNPLRSDVHGAFGSCSLILLAIVAPLALAPIRQMKARMTMVILWFAAAVIFLGSLGDNAPVYYLFWKVVPFADSFRIPGRIAMLLPPIFMLLLAWFFRVADDDALRRHMHPVRPWQVTSVTLLLFVCGYFLLANPDAGPYTPFDINHYPPWVNSVVCAGGIAALFLVTLRLSRWRFNVIVGLLLGVLVVLQTTVEMRYGTWHQNRSPTPTLVQMDHAKELNLAFQGEVGYGMESTSSDEPSDAAQRSSARSYGYSTLPLAVFRPLQTTAPRSDYLPVSPQNSIGPGEPVTTFYAAFNRMRFHVESAPAGFLAISVPYSSQWHVSVESQEYALRRTDRNELAVFLPAGIHDVDFCFHSPASTAGMLITCSTGLLITVLFSRVCRSKWTSFALITIAVIVLAGGFALWEHSLYGGDDLGTQYFWIGSRQ
jgi:hypothetical protein